MAKLKIQSQHLAELIELYTEQVMVDEERELDQDDVPLDDEHDKFDLINNLIKDGLDSYDPKARMTEEDLCTIPGLLHLVIGDIMEVFATIISVEVDGNLDDTLIVDTEGWDDNI